MEIPIPKDSRYDSIEVTQKDGKLIIKPFFVPIFKDGDIIIQKNHPEIALCYKKENASAISAYFMVCIGENSGISLSQTNWGYIDDYRLATEEEKERFYNVIEENGYYYQPSIHELTKKFTIIDGSFIKIVFYSTTIFAIVKSYNNETNELQIHIGYDVNHNKLICDNLHVTDINSISDLYPSQKVQLESVLELNDLYWNSEHKILSRNPWLPSKGEYYWIPILNPTTLNLCPYRRCFEKEEDKKVFKEWFISKTQEEALEIIKYFKNMFNPASSCVSDPIS